MRLCWARGEDREGQWGEGWDVRRGRGRWGPASEELAEVRVEGKVLDLVLGLVLSVIWLLG